MALFDLCNQTSVFSITFVTLLNINFKFDKDKKLMIINDIVNFNSSFRCSNRNSGLNFSVNSN